MNNYDLFEDIELLKKLVVNNEETLLLKQISDAIESSSTGSEMAMKVRYVLQQYEIHYLIHTSIPVKKHITQMINSLNQLLKT